MALTDSQIKSLIIAKIGDVDTNGNPASPGVIAANIDLIWESYSGMSTRKRALHTTRDCIDIVLARLKHLVDVTTPTGLRVSSNQVSSVLLKMREVVVTQLKYGYEVKGATALTQRYPAYPTTDAEFLNQIK